MNKIINIVFLITILISCSQIKIEKIIDYYGDGQVKSKKMYESELDSMNFVLVEFYENGKIKRTGFIRDSIEHGPWKYFYDNGKLKQNGVYIIDDSLNNGNSTYSYKLPLIDSEGDTIDESDGRMGSVDWNAREKKNLHVCKDGYWEFFHENGQLKSKGNFQNGWAIGDWEEYSLNGRLIKKSNFKDKKANGEWKYWHSNGQLMKIEMHNDSSSLLIQAYDKDGTHKVIDGDGEFIEPYPSDTLKSFLGTYKDGILNGRYVKYFENGKIEEQGQYKNGKAEGEWIHYYFYYDKSLIRNYRNGEAHGYFYNFDINEDTTQIRFFVNGSEHGVTKHMDEQTGKITLVEPWNMGKRHGIRKYYNSEGIPELYQYYIEGEMIGEEQFENGEISKLNIFEGNENEFYQLKENSQHQ